MNEVGVPGDKGKLFYLFNPLFLLVESGKEDLYW